MKKTAIIFGIILLVIIAIAGAGMYKFNTNSDILYSQENDGSLTIIDQNKAINESLFKKDITLKILSSSSSVIPKISLNYPDYKNNYTIENGNKIDKGDIVLLKKYSTIVSKVSAEKGVFYFTVPFIQKSSINGENTYIALMKKDKNNNIEHLDTIKIGQKIEIKKINDEIQMISIEYISDKTTIKKRFFVSDKTPFLKEEISQK